MIYKGANFRRTINAVMLPDEYAEGDMRNYVAFGRVCAPETDGAIKTGYNWRNGGPFGQSPGDPVYAVKVKSDGYSLTNLMYGADGYMYLGYDGQTFICHRRIWSRGKYKVKRSAPAVAGKEQG